MKARSLDPVLQQVTSAFERSLQQPAEGLQVQEVGSVRYVGQGIARINGLPGVQLEELVQFSGGGLGMVFNLEEHEIGVVLLSQNASLKAGSQAARTGRILDTPVGEALLGRVLDPLGRPLDGRPAPVAVRRLPVERPAPSIMQRAPVTTPLQTGLKVIDATIPIGRGQRELILGDRQTGKSAIALDTIINQRDQDVVCVYCAIGQRGSSTARLIADLIHYQAMDYTIVVVAAGEDSPGLQFVAPYAATTIAEYFMEQGQDVLVVYDDLTNHARSYRELSLLLRRPPGREAFPGDIFYIHSRLLERATQMKDEFGGGSLSALPIVETEAQNVSAYIPTNLISITDGQIYLSPDLFQKGVLPAVDVGQSVSRVGGKTQLAAYREVAGALRLSYSQFEELEAFSRFGTRLDEETQKIIEHGQRVREALKQPQYHPMPVAEQIAALLSVTEGLLDEAPLEQVAALEMRIRHAVTDNLPDLSARIQAGEILGETQRKALLETAQEAIQIFQAEQALGND